MDPDARSGSSPEPSLSNVLRGRRRKQTDDTSAPPPAVNDNLNVDRGNLLRNSLDRGLDKLRDRASRSNSIEPESATGSGHDAPPNSRKLDKILSKTSRRRRKKGLDQGGGEESEEHGLFLTATDGSYKTVDALALEPNNDSSDSLPQRGKSVASSLMTEDFEPE